MAQVRNTLTPGKLITLYEFDFTTALEGGSGVWRVTGRPADSSYSSVTWDSKTWGVVDITLNPITYEVGGKMPETTLSVENKPAHPFNSLTDVRGTKLTRYKVFNGETVNLARKDVLYISQLEKLTSWQVDFKVAVNLGLERLDRSATRTLNRRCQAIYRSWGGTTFDYTPVDEGGCPYGQNVHGEDSTRYFDADDNSTADPAADRCSKQIKGCQLRFDPNKTGELLPFVGVVKYYP